MGDHSQRRSLTVQEISQVLLTQLTDLAHEAANQATELIRDRRPSQLQVDHKSTATDMVTNMDLASEALIREVILSARPQDRFIGEESGTDNAATATGQETDEPVVTWVVDPIDGTTNYLYDLPGYNISIAAEVAGETVVGVVADPAHGRIYSAAIGSGAFCDGTPLRVPNEAHHASSLDRALIATGFGYSPDLRARQALVVAELIPRVRDIRRLGAAALDLCHVAAGRVDGYFEVNLGPWDLAAGALIAREAGAIVAHIDGGPPLPGSVVAASPAIYDQLQAILAELNAGSVLAP